MTYEKQTWNKYDDLKTEEENIQNGAVVTDNRMNHMEEGISTIDLEITSHESNKTNPHSVTKEQVGLSNVSNYGIATEAEATAGTSNEKYMTPSLTKKAAKSYVDKTDVGLSNVNNVKQASKSEFDDHTANKTNPHGVTAAQVGAYNKSETDAKFNQTIRDRELIKSGTNLNDVKEPGFYEINGSGVLNLPDVYTDKFYGILVVMKNPNNNSTVQQLFDAAVNTCYTRTASGATLTWKIWKKLAIDSEVVHITGDQEIKGTLTIGDLINKKDTDWTTLGTGSKYKKSGSRVTIAFDYTPATNANFNMGTLPEGVRPTSALMIVVAAFSSNATLNNHVQINEAGTCTLLAPTANQVYRFQVSFEI